ncbi:MAG: HesA/MoeB/ThiF family protein, partial [Thermodesulfobacteriota bacterium]
MLSQRALLRYDRQIMLDVIGERGQEKLQKSRILIAGAGGLGSAAAYYLAAAGTGNLRIVDADRVEFSNLNRQILHWEKDVDRPKVESAGEKLAQFNTDIVIEALREEINEKNLPQLAEECDLVVDGLDNFPTRYLLNEYLFPRGIPLIYGGILGMMGMATVILPGRTPCLKCLFPQAPPPQKFPVLGTTPGMIGLIQANEAVKYLVGFGKLLAGRLLIYNGMETRFSEIQVEPNPDCSL